MSAGRTRPLLLGRLVLRRAEPALRGLVGRRGRRLGHGVGTSGEGDDGHGGNVGDDGAGKDCRSAHLPKARISFSLDSSLPLSRVLER